MENRKSQLGSVHLIIIVVLSIALIGSLGFVFYQNFVQSKTNQSAETKKDTPAIQTKETTNINNDSTLTEIAADNLVGTNLAIKYPKKWITTSKDYSSVEAGTPMLSTFYAISSPDNNLTVNFNTTNVGRGGMCDATPGHDISQLDKSNIPGFEKAIFVSYSDNSGVFFAGVHENNEKAQSAKIGDSSCSTATFGSQSGLVSGITNSKSLNVGLQLEIEFNNIKHDGTSEASAKFRQALNTENYKIAKSIIESLYVK